MKINVPTELATTYIGRCPQEIFWRGIVFDVGHEPQNKNFGYVRNKLVWISNYLNIKIYNYDTSATIFKVFFEVKQVMSVT